jgi:L-cysteine S-thiosulfotransferase
MRYSMLSGAAVILALAFACTPAHKSSSGFHLPDGDPAKGRSVFIAMKCNTCHQVAGVEMPPVTARPQGPVILGGAVPFARTDGELATSIIDPSYKMAVGYRKEAIGVVGRSHMPDMTHAITIRQMIDLVAFLQAHYQVQPTVQIH